MYERQSIYGFLVVCMELNIMSTSGNKVKNCPSCKNEIDESSFSSHITKCLKRYEHASISREDRINSMALCERCGKSLDHLNVVRKAQHIKRCLERKSNESVESAHVAEDAHEVLRCPLCTQHFSTKQRRILHLKKCEKAKGLSPSTKMKAVKLYDKQIEEQVQAGLPIMSFKPGITKDSKMKKKHRAITSFPRGDPDIQVAMALSLSECEEEKQAKRREEEFLLESEEQSSISSSLEILSKEERLKRLVDSHECKKSSGKRRDAHRKRTYPLILTTPEQRFNVIQAKFGELITESENANLEFWPPLSEDCVHPIPTVLYLKNSNLASFWKGNSLWNASNLSDINDLSQFYVPSLKEIIHPSDAKIIEVGTNFKSFSQIPGRRKSSFGYKNVAENKEKDFLNTQESTEDEQTEEKNESSEIYAPCCDFNECSIEDVQKSSDDKLKLDFGKLVNSATYSDLKIIADGGIIAAHKIILFARCPHMLKYIDKNKEINLTNFSYNSVKSLLNYLYSGQVNSYSECELSSLLELAKHFCVKHLVKMCQALQIKHQSVSDDCVQICRLNATGNLDVQTNDSETVLNTNSSSSVQSFKPRKNASEEIDSSEIAFKVNEDSVNKGYEISNNNVEICELSDAYDLNIQVNDCDITFHTGPAFSSNQDERPSNNSCQEVGSFETPQRRRESVQKKNDLKKNGLLETTQRNVHLPDTGSPDIFSYLSSDSSPESNFLSEVEKSKPNPSVCSEDCAVSTSLGVESFQWSPLTTLDGKVQVMERCKRNSLEREFVQEDIPENSFEFKDVSLISRLKKSSSNFENASEKLCNALLGKDSSKEDRNYQSVVNEVVSSLDESIALENKDPKVNSSKSNGVKQKDITMEAIAEPSQNKVSRKRKKKKKNQAEQVTPLPHYSVMETPELKSNLAKYGLKKLPKKMSVKILKHIYDEVHPLVTDSDETEATDHEEHISHTQRVPVKVKKTSRISLSQPAMPADRADFINGVKETKKSRLNKNPKETSRSAPSSESCEDHSLTDGDGEDVFEESYVSSQCDSSTEDVDSLEKRFMKFIKKDKDLYLRIIKYEPLEIDMLCKKLKEAGIKHSFNALMDFLDKQCITFRFNSKGRRYQKARRRKN